MNFLKNCAGKLHLHYTKNHSQLALAAAMGIAFSLFSACGNSGNNSDSGLDDPDPSSTTSISSETSPSSSSMALSSSGPVQSPAAFEDLPKSLDLGAFGEYKEVLVLGVESGLYSRVLKDQSDVDVFQSLGFYSFAEGKLSLSDKACYARTKEIYQIACKLEAEPIVLEFLDTDGLIQQKKRR